MLKTSVRAVLGAVFLAIPLGCHEYINPWEDDTIGPDRVTTASVEGVRAHVGEPRTVQRDDEQVAISAQDGTVSHFPLWWEDPLEDHGSDDGKFAWTGEDYLAMPYCLGRMIVNTIAMPVSAVVQAPVPLMGSDGIDSRQILGDYFDAAWYPGGASVTPPDILELQESRPGVIVVVVEDES